jgi:hypothetical protein
MWTPTSDESRRALKQLREEALSRGDRCLALILSGVELYVKLGREYDLLTSMKQFADEMREPVEKTPTAEELEHLFRREPPQDDCAG